MANQLNQQLGDLSKKLGRLEKEFRTNLCQQATANMARKVRDKARENVYIAPAPFVHYSTQSSPWKQLLQPGWIKRNIVMKQQTGKFLPRRLVSQHNVTVSNIKDGRFAKNVAIFIEYGVPAHNIPPKPFMRPAFDTEAPKALQDTKLMLKNKLNDWAKND